MLHMPDLAVSSGSACSAADPQPSHVLRGIGLDEDSVRSSLRFGLGRFNTESEVDEAIKMILDATTRLRSQGA
jgi:cysteine desulfurase